MKNNHWGHILLIVLLSLSTPASFANLQMTLATISVYSIGTFSTIKGIQMHCKGSEIIAKEKSLKTSSEESGQKLQKKSRLYMLAGLAILGTAEIFALITKLKNN